MELLSIDEICITIAIGLALHKWRLFRQRAKRIRALSTPELLKKVEEAELHSEWNQAIPFVRKRSRET